MEFINDKNLKHSFFKDITRINYSEDMEPNLINDYGYSYIMLIYGEFESLNFRNEKVEIPKFFVKGTGDYFTVTAKKNSSWLSFEMPNHFLHNITKIHSTQNRNQLIDLSLYVEKEVIDTLYNELRDVHHPKEIVEILDLYLGEYYEKWSVELESTKIVKYIIENNGKLALNTLLENFSYSQRTLARIFYKEVGTTPYRFICLVRFNYMIRKLQNDKETDLQDLIFEYNYFDHSHFEKDFKKFLGQSLKGYKNNNNLLLDNGLSRIYKK